MHHFSANLSHLISRRYIEASKAVAEKAHSAKLSAAALTCYLNIAACRLKLSEWQDAIEKCTKVKTIFRKRKCYKSNWTKNIILDELLAYHDVVIYISCSISFLFVCLNQMSSIGLTLRGK